MPFKTASVRNWAKEWRQSDWRETIPLSMGRECPQCLATVCGGKSWRDHELKHQKDAEKLERMDRAVRVLADAVRILATEAGHGDWYGDGGEDAVEDVITGGVVIGSGPLPPEMRGGEA